jgi:hypothetical protein
MKPTRRRYSKCFSIAMLAGAFLMSSEMPLLASPPQQSNTAGQKQDDPLPDAPQSQSAQTTPSQQPAPVPSGVAGAKAADVKELQWPSQQAQRWRPSVSAVIAHS